MSKEFSDAIQYDAEGNATLSVDKITEEINDEYLNKHIKRNKCSLTWHDFSEPQWFQILDLVEKRPSITFLELEHGTMTHSVVSRLVAIPHITKLAIETMNIEPDAVVPLAASTHIDELELIRFEKLTKEALAPFATNTSIKTLYIADMGEIDGKGIVALLAGNKTLKHLKLRNLELPEDDVAAIFANDLQHAVTHVTLEQELTEKGMRAIAANTKVDTLDLGYYPLSKASGAILATAGYISSLTLLNMEVDNDLVEALSQNTSITNLSLAQNSTVNNKGAEFLAKNTHLKKLNIRWARVNEVGLAHFLENTTLQELIFDPDGTLKGKVKTMHTKVQEHIAANAAGGNQEQEEEEGSS